MAGYYPDHAVFVGKSSKGPTGPMKMAGRALGNAKRSMTSDQSTLGTPKKSSLKGLRRVMLPMWKTLPHGLRLRGWKPPTLFGNLLGPLSGPQPRRFA